jgi:hypothetical protein
MIKHNQTVNDFKPWERRIYDRTLHMIAEEPTLKNPEIARRLHLSDTAVVRPAMAARLTLGVEAGRGRRSPEVSDQRRFRQQTRLLNEEATADAQEDGNRPSSVRSIARQLISSAHREGITYAELTIDDYQITLLKT